MDSSLGLDGILVLYEKLYETVLEEGLPHIDEGFDDLLRIGALKGLQPTLVEKTYTCASALIKLLAPSLLITLDKSPSAPIPSTSSSPPPPPIHITVANLWSTLSPYLSSDRPHVRNCVAGIWSVLLRRARGAIASRLIEVMLLGGSCSAEREEKIEKRYEEGVVLVLSDSMKVGSDLPCSCQSSLSNAVFLFIREHRISCTLERNIYIASSSNISFSPRIPKLLPFSELWFSSRRL